MRYHLPLNSTRKGAKKAVWYNLTTSVVRPPIRIRYQIFEGGCYIKHPLRALRVDRSVDAKAYLRLKIYELPIFLGMNHMFA